MEVLRLQLCPALPGLEIRSVDGFQGREKEAVVLSLVRSNPAGELGFLAERRRLNVAVTRGRRQVAVVADAETVSRDAFLEGFLAHAREEGEVRSAAVYAERVAETEMVRPEGMELTLKDVGVGTRDGGKKKKDDKSQKAPERPKRPDRGTGGETNAINKAFRPKEEKPRVDEEAQQRKDEAKRKDFASTIDDFLRSSETRFDFPATLNSHDRLVVHELAEERGLAHSSVGDGNERRIVLRKVGGKEEEEEDVEGSEKEQEEVEGGEFCDLVTCGDCRAEMPRANMELHKVRCKGRRSDMVKPATVRQEVKVAQPKNKKKGKKSRREEEEEDIDKLLASFDKMDNVCNAQGCKQKLSVLGVTCEHCRVRFCLGHGIPEAHGCGEAARRAARAQVAREGKIHPGSGRPDHRPDPARRRQLEKKLGKKLGEMEEQRRTKKKEK